MIILIDKFKIGDTISLKVDSTKVGIIIGVYQSTNDISRYKVFHNQSDISEYYENQIIMINSSEPIIWLNNSKFTAVLNAKKYGFNADNIVYSLNSGKVKFIPFQFRPLTKLINSSIPRLLIADEVGVGKTIESGIIIKEFEKRNNIKKIMIICPKELTSKWRREMKEKFDESFEVLTSDRLNYCLVEMESEGVWPSECNKCIIGLELFRREEIIQRLISLDDSPEFDMLIVDEAHHITTQTSNSHVLIEYLCEHTEIVLFLSATPLQLGSNDLFSLLNLLDPSEYIDSKIFTQMVLPNKYINGAIRKIRNNSSQTWQLEALDELKSIQVNDWATNAYSNNSVLRKWVNRLAKQPMLTNLERVDCIKDLESLHSLFHIINRTKRKDIGEFTVREPITVQMTFTDQELEFYNEVRDFKSIILKMKYGPIVTSLIMSTIERQLTSSIPAFLDLLDNFIENGLFSISGITDDIETEDTEINIKSNNALMLKIFQIRAMAERLPKTDLKTERLIEIAKDTISNTNEKKLLVFSFFKHTLRYLISQIGKTNIRVAILTGETPNEQRDSIRNRFRLPSNSEDAIDVLLSSEVGCEGLDYEFCSRIVNFDIPWNPMKIEQRIGRIDRFGQKSPKVQIYNFITSGTIEEKVFFRCYERLGIFNSTIGDLEDVLGTLVSELTQTALDIRLTDKQIISKANQLSDNALRLAEEQREFEKNSKELFLVDVKDDDNSYNVGKETQILATMNMVRCYLNEVIPNSVVTQIDNEKGYKVRMFREDKQKIQSDLTKMKKDHALDRNSKSLKQFESYLSSDNQIAYFIFEHLDETDYTNKFLITVDHPIQLLATGYFSSINSIIETSLSISTDILQCGSYAFGCFEWTEFGYRNKKSIRTVLYNFDNDQVHFLESNIFDYLLNNGMNIENPGVDVSAALLKIDNNLFNEQMQKKTLLYQANAEYINRRITTLDRYYGSMTERLRSDIYSSSSTKIKRMKSAQLEKTMSSWESKIDELRQKLNSDITIKLIAQGYLEVKQNEC